MKELDLEGHEDDPDATSGIKDIDNATLPAKPAAESIYDFNSLFKSIAAVRSTAAEEELKGFDQIEKALTLIGNGKKLKMEDVAFDDPEIGIQWPMPLNKLVLSEKDKQHPTLSEFDNPFIWEGK